jgi:hypothetical protein
MVRSPPYSLGINFSPQLRTIHAQTLPGYLAPPGPWTIVV